ncbi:uncharacterized protein LOC135500230 [Lineus longissimus]|uniref:uncharacterized protein LOC135500230 n=1 Tax=Lineus longissimus TaxID=88925 RepID=UPI002B4DB28F
MWARAMGNLLVRTAAVDFGIQWVLWVVAAALKTEKFYDLAGSGTFLLLAYQALQWGGTRFPRQSIQSDMVMVWAFRLGAYLFTRILKEGKDRRFNGVRDNPGKFFMFWTIQGVWIFVTLLPTLIMHSKKRDTPVGLRDYTGWSMWLIGFLIEVIADYQKSAFRNNPDNEGKFIQNGLWSISRHPNYFGEILLWFGLYISASSTFSKYEYLSVLSPVAVAFLLNNVSGVPLLEASAKRRWGTDPGYIAYKRRTPSLIPFIGWL